MRLSLYLLGGILWCLLMRTLLAPDTSWTTAALFGLAFTVLYGLVFDTWYRRRIFRQELEDG